MLQSNSTIKLIKNLDVTDLSGEKVMIDFESGKYFLLKGSSNEIWDLLSKSSEGVTVSAIVSYLMEIYDVNEENCRNSVISFLDNLNSLGFISIS